MSMDLSPVVICSRPSLLAQLFAVFCLLWPFATLGMLRRGERSSAPVLAMLLPLTLAMGLVWVGLSNVILGMSLSGAGDAAASAGIAEALGMPAFALFPIALIAIFALLRRHRPSLDHFSAAIAAALWVELIAALLFSARIAPFERNRTLALVWAAAALMLAAAVAMRLVLVLRRRVVAPPLRFGVPVTAISFVAAVVVLYQQVHRYWAIAISG